MADTMTVLYGSEVPKTRVVGYCKRHHVGLTAHQLKLKKCLGKNCRHLHKYEANSYWEQRRVIKAKRKGGE